MSYCPPGACCACCAHATLTHCQPLVLNGLNVDAPAHRLQQRPQPLNSHVACKPSSQAALEMVLRSRCVQLRPALAAASMALARQRVAWDGDAMCARAAPFVDMWAWECLHDSAVVAACSEDMATPEAASSTESSHFSQQDLDFCRQLPRVELHAHLNGCVQLQTLRCCIICQYVICHASFGMPGAVDSMATACFPVLETTCRRLVQQQGLSLTPQQEDALASTGKPPCHTLSSPQCGPVHTHHPRRKQEEL